MREKKRYLVGYRNSAVVPKSIQDRVASFANGTEKAQSVRILQMGQHVIEMTDDLALELSQQPDLIVEQDIELEMFCAMPGLSPRVPTETDLSLVLKVIDEVTNEPVDKVTVYCAGSCVTYKGVTDKEGTARARVYESQLQQIIVSPKDTYWSKVLTSLEMERESQLTVSLSKIPVDSGYGWGHRLLGIDKISRRVTGKGIKIGIVDSGIAEQQDLRVSGGYNTVHGRDTKAWNADENGHGTHCAGIVAAQQSDLGIIGVAPRAEIYGIKVFPGGRLSDLLEAINWCIENYMDVISIGLGTCFRSVQIEQALQEAWDRGITCIAAAGNNAGAVAYPAACDSVMAVSAIGKVGVFPQDSAHQLQIGDYFSHDGELFFARFSNYGPEITVCAPGVAILSFVPTGYAAWDGTSMACQFVAGLATLILDAYPEIRTGDGWQPYYVRQIIESSSVDLGLPREMQGAGLPNAELALAQACVKRDYEELILSSYRDSMQVMLERAKISASGIQQSLEKLKG